MHLQACDPGFPIRGMTDEGTFWGKMAGNYMKIKKSTFLGKYNGGTWGFKSSFWVNGGSPLSLPC